ncbi:MAG TPA: hypothetical protein VM580_08575, partial [Labilithrix sp.]|nr:hypothetical protein [Labilithrix sp.]
SDRLEDIYIAGDAYEGVGAAMVIELIGRQADCFVADEFRRQTKVPRSALTWLDLHEELEVEHSSESLDLARLVPRDARAMALTWQGAGKCAAATWAFMSDMYRLLYA